MNTDIRLSVEFFDHPKTVKLQRRLGLEAVVCLQRLWLWAAQNRPDGQLSNMDAEDVEIAAKWVGESGVLCSALSSLGWINEAGGIYSLHDWEDHNSWAADAEDRSDKGRFSRLAQVAPGEFEKLKKAGVSSISKTDYNAIVKRKQGYPATNGERQANAGGPLAPAPAPEERKTGGEGIYAHAHVATSVPENPDTHSEIFLKSLERPTSSPEVDPEIVQGDEQFLAGAKRRDGPKKTDSPSKGHPQWVSFLSCWQVYPVQQGQEDAWREWMRLHDAGTLATCWEIRDAILTMIAEDTRWQRGKVPKMAKWLSGKGWNDQSFVEPAQTTAVAVRDGPPVARTAYQQQRQGQTSLAGAVLQADRRLKQHGDNSENHYGNGQNVDGLPPPAITGGIASHGGSMDGIIAGSGR